MLPGTIYHRLIATYALILLIGGLGSWWLADGLFSATLEKRLEKQLKETTELLARGEIPHTPGLLRRISKLIDTEIVLSDDEGEIILATHPVTSLALSSNLNSEPVNATRANTLVISGQKYLLVQTPVIHRKQPTVALVSALADLSDLHATSRQMAYWLSIGAVVSLLLLAWIGHRTSRRITVPLAQLARMAKAIASGNREVQVTVPPQREIGELAKTLNFMSGELKRYESQIVAQSRMATLGEMTSRIAHEIRNPLTALKMQMQLLRESCDSQQARLVDGLLRETKRLELIVSTTLQYRRHTTPQWQSTQLNELISEIVELVRPQFEHQRILISSDLDSRLPPTELDRDMLQQVLLNLLMNAKDELPDGGNIKLETSLSRNSKLLVVKVQDDGPGIEKADKELVFHQAKSNKPGGFGLGLQLSRELIELHDGTIAVDEGQLGGACFTITLPIRNTA